MTAALAGCAAGGPGGSAPPPPTPAPTDRLGYGNPPADSVATVTPERVDEAIEAIPGSVEALMDQTGVPGVAVAVVYQGETVYADGFGVRSVDKDEPVEADTVFQMASVSKSIGATVVAHEVGAGTVDWDSLVVDHLPEFSLSDPWVTEHLTIADLYAHRSGLWEHAGDDLEDLGYDRATILERLRLVPLAPFRSTYAYGNFDITAAAEAVSRAAGEDWADLSERVLYDPLGMDSTSSRFEDYLAEEDRVDGHILDGDEWIVTPVPRDADPESPAGGVSSSASDMATWLKMVLDVAGPDPDPDALVPPDALLPAITAQIPSAPAGAGYGRSGFYGYGFNVSVTAGAVASVSHSGAFYLGTGTNFQVLPAEGLGIVVLVNATANGVAEAIGAEFMDRAQFGDVRQDWFSLYHAALSPGSLPEGELVGKNPPADPVPARPLAEYAGTYGNEYFGDATVTVAGDRLELAIGPGGRWPLHHWDGDVFFLEPLSENSPLGSRSKVTFQGSSVLVEHLDEHSLGTFTR